MASKAGKKKGAASVATSVAETIVGAPAPVVEPDLSAYSPASTATAPPQQPEVPRPPAERDPETPSLPAHLEVLETPLGDDPSPDELLAALNHVVLVGGIPKHEFDSIYLHHFSALGATQETADQQWNALLEKGARERAAAQELARVMQEQALESAKIRPWNPLAELESTKQLLQQQANAFAEAKLALNKEAGGADPAAHIKDRIAKDLGERSGIGYAKANAFVAAWAMSSSDTSDRSIALQVATAQKFGLELTPYISGMDKYFSKSNAHYHQLVDDARAFVDAQYERTQEWFAKRKITHLHLFRGMKGTVGAQKGTDKPFISSPPVGVTVHQNPLSSWTVNYWTAKSPSFSGPSGYMLTARVPVSKVVGSCFTGLGCLEEKEFVVLGGLGLEVTAVANFNDPYHPITTSGGWHA